MGCTSSTLPVDVEAYESVYASPTAKRRRRAKPLGVYKREEYRREGHRLSSQETDPGGSSSTGNGGNVRDEVFGQVPVPPLRTLIPQSSTQGAGLPAQDASHGSVPSSRILPSLHPMMHPIFTIVILNTVGAMPVSTSAIGPITEAADSFMIVI
ncbi:hypothetical protein FOZ63_033178 [Perkinsus olseni]|uniref:Uncharacterized protein n=1 Tax=Perkinsus olseni TaxID=32597 RepID=A0A7J6Q3A4_PEROL|nr:hypothetical protein FOZ63_033178 [Perkinsus olseni]KAF4733388.1 hypothetical protein FOZ62_031703 [Perkinsus olseni]